MAHQGQIIAFAEFSYSQSEAIKHTNRLMGHMGRQHIHRHQNWPLSQVPETSLSSLCGRTGVGVGGTESRRPQEEKEKGPRWAPQHLLGTCCVPRPQEEDTFSPVHALRGRLSSQTPGRSSLRWSFSEPHNGLLASVPQLPGLRISVLSFLASSLRSAEPPIKPREAIFQSPTANTNTAEANFTDFYFEASPLSQNPSVWEISCSEVGKKIRYFKIQHKTLS